MRILQYPSHMALLRALPLSFALLLSLSACEQAVVTWIDKEADATNLPSPLLYPPYLATDSALVAATDYAEFLLVQDLLREAGAPTLLMPALEALPESKEAITSHAMLAPVQTGPAPQTPLGNDDRPIDTLRCARSLRMASAGERGDVAVWWSRGVAGRVRLVAAWRDGVQSTDSITVASAPSAAAARFWRGPIMVDSLDQGPGDAQAADRGAYGCARPAPSVAVDARHGYVHVTYALTGPEGPGVFYAHQMDPRSAFEPPVAIIYGDRLGDARLAVSGDAVAVVYEDPNSSTGRRRIGLAISRTSGHLFEDRLTASSATANARDPHVAVRGRAVVIGWSETAADSADPIFRLRRARISP